MMRYFKILLLGLCILSCNKDIKEDDVLNRLPEKFNLQTVPNNAKDVALLPELSWQASIDKDEDAITYTLYLGQESDPQQILAEDLRENTFALLEPLSYNTTYYWKVVAKDENGGTTNSNTIFQFTTKEENFPPVSFKLLEVADGAEEVVLTPTLTWEVASDPNEDEVTYRLYLDDKEDPTSVLFDKLSKNEYEIKEPLQEGTTYYWKVEAIDEEGLSVFSETIFSFTTIKKNTPPVAFDLLTPLNESGDLPLLPTLTWENAEDNEGDLISYSILLSENPNPSITIETDIETNSFTLKNALKEFNTYYWKVVATDSRGLSTESNQVFSFTTKKVTGTLEAFNLITPQEGATEISLTPDLVWEESVDSEGGAVVYDVYLGTEQNPGVKIAQGITETSFSIGSPLQEFTTYNWKIVAVDEQGLERGSNQIFSFTTKKITGTLEAFNLLSPENEVDKVSLTPDLVWEKAMDSKGGAVVYDVYFGLEPNPDTKIATGISETTFSIIDPLEELQTYYWKVVAIDEQGLDRESDQFFSFTTKKITETLESFNLIAPEDSVVAIGLTPELSWEASVDSAGGTVVYDVYIGTTENPENKVGADISETTFAVAAPLEEFTVYYWKIVAKDAQGLEKESNQIFSFTTEKVTGTLESFNLVAPADTATEISLTPELSWEESVDSEGGAVVYDVYIAVDEIPDPGIMIAQNVGETSFSFGGNALNEETTYFWKVVARDTQGLTLESSQVFSFTTLKVNTAPEPFQLIGVTNNAEGVDVLPVFTWEPATDPDGDELKYTVYLDQNPDPQTVLATDISGTEYRTVNRLKLLEKYYWKVKVEDGKGGEYTSEVFTFTTRSLIGEVRRVTSNAAFGIRRGHTLTVFNNRLWIIGGDDDIDDEYDDVWSSADGENWVQEVTNAPFGPRQAHQTVVYDNKMWVIGGRIGAAAYDDVWYSDDGRNWTKATDDTPFFGLLGFSTIVFNNRIWVFDTFAGGGASSNQAWSSNDGINWVNEANNLPFGPRFAFTINQFNGRLWIIGGRTEAPLWQEDDVWSSADGRSWRLEKDEAGFPRRAGHHTVELDGKFWIIGGEDEGIKYNDIWCSKDILNWDLYKENQDSFLTFAQGSGYQAAVFDNKIWLTGGFRDDKIVAEIWTIK